MSNSIEKISLFTGELIPFQGNKIINKCQICVYDFYTGEELQVTTGPGDKENPVWAPDSLHVLYNSQGQIYLINLNDPKPVAITSGPGEKRFPAWEPG